MLIAVPEDLKTVNQVGSTHKGNLWKPTLNLLKRHKLDFISGQDFNDKRIHAAQKLLKNQFPYLDGLLDPVLVSTHNIPSTPTQEAVQLH